MKNNKGFVVPILLAIIVIFVAGGGVYMYSQSKKTPEPDNSINQPENLTSNTSNETDEKIYSYSPNRKYYAKEDYIKTEFDTCCGNDELKERKVYSISVYDSSSKKLIREFKEFNMQGYAYTPRIQTWYSDDILKMYGEYSNDAITFYYDISKNQLISEGDFEKEN